ncbi:MAG: LysR family transcriptional regulator [Polyangiaceae bacterium]|nr:LysR family transcriptional regulator [Polyangiaceae bacterium]
MSSNEPSWDLYGAFLAVMQQGSLSAAARALGVAQPTVRRQLERLEAELDVVLFTRSPNGLTPTELALSTLPYAESMASMARALVRATSAPDVEERGTVRVGASEIVGAEVLPHILTELLATHPKLQVELALSNKNEDLLRRSVDVAVRMVRPTQENLLAKRVGKVELGFFASPTYLALRGSPKQFGDLLDGQLLVGPDRDQSFIEALRQGGLDVHPRHFALRTDNQLAQLAALRVGLGIGVCQVPLARRAPVLQRVLPQISFHLEFWVVTHEDLKGSARVRAVFDQLVRRLATYLTP